MIRFQVPGKRLKETSRKKFISLVLCAFLFALSIAVDAQEPVRVRRVGYLTGSPLSDSTSRIEAFRQGLRELGYVEGKDIVIDWRSWEGKLDRQQPLAAELVRLKVDVIVTGGNSATRAAKESTSSIPIIMTQASDPVATGFVASLAQPGGNITGLANLSPELSGKRLELLKEIIPGLSRVAVFGGSSSPGNPQALKEIDLAAGALGIKVRYFDVLSLTDLDTALRGALKDRCDAVLMKVSGSITGPHRKQIAERAVRSRLPVVYSRREHVEAGGLIAYGPSYVDSDRRAATYVDKILKGAKPADLPVEQAKKFEFVINLKTAKQIGLTVPSNVLLRADRVIR